MNRINYFPFCRSYYEAIEALTPEEQVLVYTAICKYVFEGEITENLGGASKAVFHLIIILIDMDLAEER